MYSFLHHPNLSKTENVVLQVILLTLRSCYKLNRCYIKLSLVNILENVFVFIEILFKMLLFEGSVLIYAEHCIYIFIHSFMLEMYRKNCTQTRMHAFGLLQYLCILNLSL